MNLEALYDRAGRLLSGYGLIEARFDHCVQALGNEEITVGRSALVEKDRVADPAQALAFFSTYTFPATRHILFSNGEGWTAAVNNSKNGSDFTDYSRGWCRAVRARTLRVVDRHPVVWKKGDLRVVMKYEARIIELFDEWAHEVRTITCAHDGNRWVWHLSGEPLPVEAGFSFSAKRVKDRFTRDNLRAFLAFLTPSVVDADAFLKCKSFSLIEETYKSSDWMARIQAAACTESELDEPAHRYFQRGLGWMNNLETHYSSAIADFERALEINPDYETRVRPHLDRAYRFARGR